MRFAGIVLLVHVRDIAGDGQVGQVYGEAALRREALGSHLARGLLRELGGRAMGPAD